MKSVSEWDLAMAKATEILNQDTPKAHNLTALEKEALDLTYLRECRWLEAAEKALEGYPPNTPIGDVIGEEELNAIVMSQETPRH